MLLESEIKAAMRRGQIIIEPYRYEQMGPNSYNLRLGDQIWRDARQAVTIGKPSQMLHTHTQLPLASDGYFKLLPGQLYLAATLERVDTDATLVPCLNGRSSAARDGLGVHVTAGFGDAGYCGHWTMEITVALPTRVAPGAEIAQIYWQRGHGHTPGYAGKYQHARGVMASKGLEREK